MWKISWLLLSLVSALLGTASAASARAVRNASPPVRIILDTDMTEDVDDVGALAMLHALADRGEAEILAVMHSTGYPYTVGAIDAINTYYGRPDLPIGAYKGDVKKDAGGNYARAIGEKFPSNVKTNADVPDATTLYRRILASQPDKSVTIVTVGFLVNLENLLRSKPDRYSKRDGAALVAQKVKHLVVMGGAFPKGREFNLVEAGPAAAYSLSNWPTPIVFSGFEIGARVFTGALLEKNDPKSPVREAYRLYFGGAFKGRESWDQTAVLYAVRGLHNYWTAETEGYMHVFPDGSNEWRKAPDRDHAYLKESMPPASVAAIIQDLMTLPPMKGKRSRRGPSRAG
ncbi:MAG: nucleoside hydrolase [Armatimonadetes bacterium]|nr:nucleoside hydrolase [Armatimonadota bacterium]